MLKRKRILLTVGVLILLLGAFSVLFLLIKNNDGTKDSDKSEAIISALDLPCSVRAQGSILSEAASVFLISAYADSVNNERGEKIIQLRDRILGSANFENDDNCLHILTMAYISGSDSVRAEKYLTLLEGRLKNENPESYILDENANFRSIPDMKNSIAAIKFNEEKARLNNPYGEQPRLEDRSE